MKRNVRGWLAALCCAVAVVGCGDDDMPGADSGPTDGGRDSSVTPDGGDECEGRTLCTTIGTSCDGDEVVTCANDADGCRVETREDCGADGDICNVTGGTASCIDPCLLIPTEMRCDAAGRSCDGDSLEICAANEDGCFVLEATNCAAMPGGVCAMGAAMLECVLPADPCAAIPAAERCTVEGTSCMDDDLVTCAPNAFGCLVTTTTDCTTRTGGTCDDTTDPAAAICVATDACAGLTLCTTAGSVCDGPELVTCGPDAFGCLVETTEDCTDATFGFCDAEATPSDICSTAAVDPCMGVTECGTEASRVCSDASTLSICAANAFGCFVTETTNCATAGDVCDASGEMPICVDPCSLIDTCAAVGTSCIGNEIVTCALDANSCIAETRTACAAGELCDASGAAPVCIVDTICPQAGTRVLDCASGTVSGDTAMGTDVGTAVGECATSGYEGNEQYWRFRHTGTTPVAVQIRTTHASTVDHDLFVLDGGDGTLACTTATLDCLDESTLTTATEDVGFLADPGDLAYVVFDNWGDDTSTSTYTLTVSCVEIVCGNGSMQGTETCDDGNTTTGDGCSATCTIETGFTCFSSPSVCAARGSNSACTSALAITGDATITGEDIALGGPRPQGTECGTTTGDNALYYAVTIPALTRVAVTTTSPSGLNRVLLVQDACGATSCAFRTDTSPEGTTLRNDTAAPVTRIVTLHNNLAAATGTYTIAFDYTAYACGNGALEGAEVCDDANTASGDGCSATCAIESGYTCAGTPSSCYMPAPNGTCAAAAAITSNTTFTGVNTRAGGARPTATGCGSGAGTDTHYYGVTIPAGATVTAQTTPLSGLDIILFTLNACSDAACASSTDTAPERVTLTNATAAPITRIVGVRPWGTSHGRFDIAFTYAVCGNGVVEGAETCDDMGTTAGDGCSATCAVEPGYVCTGAPSTCRLPYITATIPAACVTTGTWTPLTRSGTGDDATTAITALPFAFSYFGSAMTHYSTNTNGMAQLWSSTTGTPSGAFTNTTLPNSSTPNGTLAAFWDDLFLGTGFDVHVQTTGAAGSQVFVIEWLNATVGGASLTFQAHLIEGTNVVEYHYCSIGAGTAASGSSATIGIENLTGTAGIQTSYNTPAAVMTGSGFRYTPNP